MNRLHILLAVMVVMLGALFAGQEALAKVFTGTSGEDTLVGTDSFTGRDGEDRLKGSRGNDKIFPGEGNDKVYAGYGKDLIYARDTEGVDYIARTVRIHEVCIKLLRSEADYAAVGEHDGDVYH